MEHKINIEDIKAHVLQRQKWNSMNINNINLYKDGKPFEINKKVLDELSYTGFNTIDVIQFAIGDIIELKENENYEN